MKYEKTVKGKFLDRPNRFIARVQTEEGVQTVHVKNTGRCRELFVAGAEVVLEESDNPDRKTKYDLICVRKGQQWVNVDSQIPNKAAAQWIRQGGLFPEAVTVRPEKTYGNSRFDLYVESSQRKAFIEVKGVTLEDNGIARFPDAPTQRGVKHVRELSECIRDGYEAYILFVIQMDGICRFEPNWETHEAFGEALVQAHKDGVQILARKCHVNENIIEVTEAVPVRLERSTPDAGTDCGTAFKMV